ncbi:hypothetical protein FACS1894132_11330 [Clostridia bacterium]|nr:hypothetical protein FACS1894132_11330 [Clostridia bacterium]
MLILLGTNSQNLMKLNSQLKKQAGTPVVAVGTDDKTLIGLAKNTTYKYQYYVADVDPDWTAISAVKDTFTTGAKETIADLLTKLKSIGDVYPETKVWVRVAVQGKAGSIVSSEWSTAVSFVTSA